MATDDDTPARVRWARLRFSIIGPLLAAPPDEGELKPRIEALAAQAWRHPAHGQATRFSFKTIERWFYAARGESDPIAILARKVPSHAGTFPKVPAKLAEAIERLHREHPRWTFQLHYDNLLALSREDPRLAPIPSYATVCRFMKQHGLLRARRKRHDRGEDFTPRETRSYEVEHVHGLWHLDFQGSVQTGKRRGPHHSGGGGVLAVAQSSQRRRRVRSAIRPSAASAAPIEEGDAPTTSQPQADFFGVSAGGVDDEDAGAGSDVACVGVTQRPVSRQVVFWGQDLFSPQRWRTIRRLPASPAPPFTVPISMQSGTGRHRLPVGHCASV